VDAITSAPAAILGLPQHGTDVGNRADLVVLRSHQVQDVVLDAPAVDATIKDGRLLPRPTGRPRR